MTPAEVNALTSIVNDLKNKAIAYEKIQGGRGVMVNDMLAWASNIQEVVTKAQEPTEPPPMGVRIWFDTLKPTQERVFSGGCAPERDLIESAVEKIDGITDCETGLLNQVIWEPDGLPTLEQAKAKYEEILDTIKSTPRVYPFAVGVRVRALKTITESGDVTDADPSLLYVKFDNISRQVGTSRHNVLLIETNS